MKLRFWLILCCVCYWVGPLAGRANSNAELIEQFPLGQINWTRGVITAKGAVAPPAVYDIDPGQTSESAFEQAVHNIFNTLMQLRVDDQRFASHLFAVNKSFQTKVAAMARASKIVHPDKVSADKEEISVQMSLYGGFAQLMLPAEIRQVQPIKPLNHAFHHHNVEKVNMDMPDAYSGLIVDARGTGAKPSMVPKLLDEKGHEVFGPAYVSREFAVQHGICKYIRMINGSLSALPRVAPNPLLVKGLRTAIPKSCNIVISNADASKLRGTSAHLKFLKQCRVIIVLD